MTDPGEALLAPPLTDSGNAERFALLAGGDFRYAHLESCWYQFDGVRWRRDDNGLAPALSKLVVRRLYAAASNIADDGLRAAVSGWARRSEHAARRTAMVQLAQCEPGIPVQPEEFDCNRMLLNVANGSIDLKTGRLHPHRREDLCSHLAPVVFNENATCPR